jgi:uncharacterized BrkB/YihY/UPF0761 family membrane protein
VRGQRGLRIVKKMEINAWILWILWILLSLATLDISIAMGTLATDYKMGPESSDDFHEETIPGSVIAVVCRFISRQSFTLF